MVHGYYEIVLAMPEMHRHRYLFKREVPRQTIQSVPQYQPTATLAVRLDEGAHEPRRPRLSTPFFEKEPVGLAEFFGQTLEDHRRRKLSDLREAEHHQPG